MEVEIQQTCFRCNTVKPLTDFIRNRKTKTGYTKECLDCGREYRRDRAKKRKAEEITVLEEQRARDRKMQDIIKKQMEEISRLRQLIVKISCSNVKSDIDIDIIYNSSLDENDWKLF